MATSTEEWIEELKTISVLELSERIKALEEAFGVSASAVAAAAPVAAGGGGAEAAEGGADGVRRRPDRRRRQEDPGHQGRPRRHRPWPEGGQGARRRGPQAGQGGHRQGRGRQAQGRARRGRRVRRAQVAHLARRTSPCHQGPPIGGPSSLGATRRSQTCPADHASVPCGARGDTRCGVRLRPQRG